MAIRVRNRRDMDVAELNREVLSLVQQLGSGAEGRLLLEESVGTSETAIPHGQEDAPRAWFACPHSDARIYRTKDPDSTNIYAAASSAATVDFLVIP